MPSTRKMRARDPAVPSDSPAELSMRMTRSMRPRNSADTSDSPAELSMPVTRRMRARNSADTSDSPAELSVPLTRSMRARNSAAPSDSPAELSMPVTRRMRARNSADTSDSPAELSVPLTRSTRARNSAAPSDSPAELSMPLTRRMRARNSAAPSDSPAVSSLPDSQGQHFIEVPDPDFHDFDSSRAAEEITPGEIWAIYDDKDGMPRYYGRIRSLSLSPFEVEFWWLVSDERTSEESKLWTRRTGYYNTTGKFENGDHSTTKIVNIFSHRMHIKEKFIRGAPTRIIIHPRKGDVWAMYRDWDHVQAIKSSENPSNVACKFDMVEILADYTKENGVKTVKLAKAPDFRAVFHRQDGPHAIQIWGTSELVRFSHNVPVAKIKPSKLNIGVRKMALELDPAAIPLGYSTDLENGSGHTEMRSPTITESEDMEEELEDGKDTSPWPSCEHKPIMDIVVSSAALCQGSVESLSRNTRYPTTDLEEIDKRPQRPESQILTELTTQISTFQSRSVSESDFYDFGFLRTETDVEAGQIWATYDTFDKMPRNYVRVVRVLESPFKVDVWRLKPGQPPSENTKSLMDCAGHSITCGSFHNDKRDVMGLECFSHLVLDKAQDRVNVYPRRGEVWAVYRSWDLENGLKVQRGLGTPHISGYDLVEIFSDFLGEGSLQLVRLDKVIGFKSLFQRQTKPLKAIVRPDFLSGFSHSIPARKMYRDDKLHIPFGALEVDPACITL